MALSYIYKDGNVTFSGIRDTTLIAGQKVVKAPYAVNDSNEIRTDLDSITASMVINAIDIDWNDATINGISYKSIRTSADLLNLIKEIYDKIPTEITQLVGGTNVLTKDNFTTIKEELQGKSAYDIAKETAQQNGQSFSYTEAQWIESLKGAPGKDGAPGLNGLSAFDIAQQTFQALGKEFPYHDETEWTLAITEGANVDAKLEKKQDVLIMGNGINISGNVISTPLATWINIS